MNQYKKLAFNTIVFAIGTFSSKLLTFLLMPLYTRVLTKADYGVADLIFNTGNLLLPLASIGIINAIVRFGLDTAYDRKDVFSTGLLSILIGFPVLLLFAPALNMIQMFEGRAVLICAFVLMSCLRSLCSQFVRACGYVRLYAFDGIFSTAATIGFNILYLVVFRLGITGYILAIISADCLSAVFLFICARLYNYVKIKGFKKSTVHAMIKYALPMIPSTLFWWITNVSDRYLVKYMISEDATGLYAVSYKIPSVVILMSGIFMDAWQMSAVTEGNRGEFFSKVFRSFQSVLVITASFLILLAKPIISILVDKSFYEAWRYIPFLVLSTVFSCLVTFLGSVYVVEKKSMLSMLTTAAGAGLNIVLNIVLIPVFGVNGAAFSTFISYLVVFILRAVDTRRFIKMKWNLPKLVMNTVLLIVQSIILILEIPNWLLYAGALTALMLIFNAGEIMASVKKLLLRKRISGS